MSECEPMTGAASVALSIPSPSTGVWDIFGLPAPRVRAVHHRRHHRRDDHRHPPWRARGGTAESLEMVAVVAVPCGIVGARLYHVITDYQLYFGPGATRSTR